MCPSGRSSVGTNSRIAWRARVEELHAIFERKSVAEPEGVGGARHERLDIEQLRVPRDGLIDVARHEVHVPEAIEPRPDFDALAVPTSGIVPINARVDRTGCYPTLAP
jgi:hypothetical protein